jgi:hypothetical protein
MGHEDNGTTVGRHVDYLCTPGRAPVYIAAGPIVAIVELYCQPILEIIHVYPGHANSRTGVVTLIVAMDGDIEAVGRRLQAKPDDP